jgi:UDP-N-acetylmuramate--alanine ligase
VHVSDARAAHDASRYGADSVRYVRSFAEAVDVAVGKAAPGDMILTLGAGSISQLGPQILEKLHSLVATS